MSELSGDFRNACLAIVDHACDPTFYVCRRLYHTMHGWGTSDWALINFVVDHCEVRKYSALCRGGEVFRCGFVFTACIALVSAHPACFHQLPLLGLQRDMDLVKERFPGVVSDISKDGKPKSAKRRKTSLDNGSSDEDEEEEEEGQDDEDEEEEEEDESD